MTTKCQSRIKSKLLKNQVIVKNIGVYRTFGVEPRPKLKEEPSQSKKQKTKKFITSYNK